MKTNKTNRRKFISKVILCGLFLMFLDKSILAQKLTDTISIQEVQVFGDRKIDEAGVLVTHIDTLALQMMKTQTISELLSSYSPVFIKSYGRGSTASASFRGTAPSHTQVYWNDIKINSPMRGDVDFSLFPVYFIDDISLFHGGSSLQSGSGALGGSVHINNNPDWKDRLSVRYIQTIESFSTEKEYLNIGFGNGKIQLKTRLFLDRSKNEFPYYNYGVLPMHQAVQSNAAYGKKGMLQEFYTRIHKNTFSAKIWFYQSNRDLPQLMSFEGDVRTENQKDENFRTVFNWKYISDRIKVEWVGGVNRTDLNYFRSSTEANFVNFDSKSNEESYTSKFCLSLTPKENLNFYWSINSIFDEVSIFDRAKQIGYEHNRLELSLLNSVHYRLLPEVSLSLLLRSDLFDNYLIGFIPSFGAQYFFDLKQQSSLKMNLSRNYHQPGLNDLYWLPGGNPNLKPEDGYSGDFGYSIEKRKENEKFSVQITGFASLIDNWIVWQPSVTGAYYWEANNLRKVFSKGIEIQSSWHQLIANTTSVDLKANYSYTATSNIDAYTSVDGTRGKQLIYIPKHKFNLFAEATLKSYFLKVNAPFTGKRFTSSNNVESDFEKVLNAYWLVNLSCGKSFVSGKILIDAALNVENLFNTDYMAILWRAMPDRYYSFNFQISYRK